MIKAAVLGSPIEHSLSPFIHNRAYEILGIDGKYEKFEIDVETFPEFIASASSLDWDGFSLTMPLKEVAFGMGFECDSRAKKIHSVNTLVRSGNSYKASSTDVLAFDRILDGMHFNNVAVIGGGGTARAALAALDGRVSALTILQRSDKRNELLLACLDKTDLIFAPMQTSLDSFDLVISTTPAGVSDIFVSTLSKSAGTLVESLYKPWPTKLSAAWRENGGKVVHGLDLLVEQALDQISFMTHQSFDYASMRETLLADVLEANSMR